MNPLKKFIFELQEIAVLIFSALGGLRKKPRYFSEIIRQMDLIGVGSLPIVLLTGFFTGGVLILQTYPTFEYYSLQNQAGRSIATSRYLQSSGLILQAVIFECRVSLQSQNAAGEKSGQQDNWQ